MYELTVELELVASPRRVWRLLTAFEAYGEWNPYKKITGNAEPHALLKVFTRHVDGEIFWPSRATVSEFELDTRLELSSVNLLLETTRFYHVAPCEGGATLRHGLRFTGARSELRILRGYSAKRAKADLEAFGSALQDKLSGRRLIPLGAGNRRMRRKSKLT